MYVRLSHFVEKSFCSHPCMHTHNICNLPVASLSTVSTYTRRQQGDGLSRFKVTVKFPAVSSIVGFVVRVTLMARNQETQTNNNIKVMYVYNWILENHSKLHVT